jgi:hypothetical protein
MWTFVVFFALQITANLKQHRSPGIGDISKQILNGYDKYSRPGLGGPPTTVECQFRFNSLMV